MEGCGRRGWRVYGDHSVPDTPAPGRTRPQFAANDGRASHLHPMFQSPLWVWLSFALVAVLLLVIYSIRWHRSPVLQVSSESTIDKLMPSLSGLTLSTAV